MAEWLLTDLHLHSTFSDGTVPMEEVVRLYGESEFDAIAITDHLYDTQSPRSLELHKEGKSVKDLESYFRTIDGLAQWAKKEYDLLVIAGLEICNLREDYHILGIDLKESIDPNQEAEALIEMIHRQGGLAIASHPPLKLSYFLQGDNESIQHHPLHLWKNRNRYASKIDAWEIGNREDLFGSVGLERFPYIANSDFHDRKHLTSWKSLIFADKEKEAIKKAIVERKVSLFFFREDREEPSRQAGRVPEEPAEPSEIHAYPHEGVEGARVLIADDERDLVEMLSYNLGRKGYQVLKAYDGYEAWKKIESGKPDLLILDLMMPELDGWELCRIIRRHDDEGIRGMSILMLSARAMPEDRVHGLQIGADDYLVKPFFMDELILRIGKLSQKRKMVGNLCGEMEHLRSTTQEKEVSLRKAVHDLKNPLISVGASARRMLRRNRTEEDQKLLTLIYNSSLRLTRWVDEALVPSDLSTRSTTEDVTDVLIQPVVERAVDSIRDAAAEKKIEVHFSPSPSIPSIPCRGDWILRAIENLLANALKYTPEGGRIDVTVTSYLEWKQGGVVEISVKDTGIGIPEKEIEKIFEPFYRGKNAQAEPGIGLGLCSAKEIVELHGGKLLVLREPGRGSTFSILLPTGDKQERKEVEAESVI